MQKVLLIGYLGRDPEVKYSQQGTAIAQFSVATTERWKDKDGEPQEHTEWFAVKAFDRLAEIAGETPSQRLPHLSRRPEAYGVLGRQTDGCQALQGSRLCRQDRVPGFKGQRDLREAAGGTDDETTAPDQDVPF